MGTSASPWTLAWASTACQKGGLDSESRLSRSGLCCHECHEDQDEGNPSISRDEGRFTCIASNKAGESRRSVKLVVKVKEVLNY